MRERKIKIKLEKYFRAPTHRRHHHHLVFRNNTDGQLKAIQKYHDPPSRSRPLHSTYRTTTHLIGEEKQTSLYTSPLPPIQPRPRRCCPLKFAFTSFTFYSGPLSFLKKKDDGVAREEGGETRRFRAAGWMGAVRWWPE